MAQQMQTPSKKSPTSAPVFDTRVIHPLSRHASRPREEADDPELRAIAQKVVERTIITREDIEKAGSSEMAYLNRIKTISTKLGMAEQKLYLSTKHATALERNLAAEKERTSDAERRAARLQLDLRATDQRACRLQQRLENMLPLSSEPGFGQATDLAESSSGKSEEESSSGKSEEESSSDESEAESSSGESEEEFVVVPDAGSSSEEAEAVPDLPEAVSSSEVAEKEAELEGRQAVLETREAKLEARQAAFETNNAKLEAWREQLETCEVELKRRAIDMADYESSTEVQILRTSSELEDRQVALDKFQTALDEREVTLKVREGALEEREAALEEREAALDERETALDKREATFEKREVALEECENALRKREAELEKSVTVRDSALKQRAAEIAECENALGEREAALEQREADLEKQLKISFGKREAALKNLEAELEQSEPVLNKREADLEEREADLVLSEAALADREAALAKREKFVACEKPLLARERTRLEGVAAEITEKRAESKAFLEEARKIRCRAMKVRDGIGAIVAISDGKRVLTRIAVSMQDAVETYDFDSLDAAKQCRAVAERLAKLRIPVRPNFGQQLAKIDSDLETLKF